MVVVHGLTAPLTMHPKRPGNRYLSSDLPHPPAVPARPVRLQAEGGEMGVFQLRSEGVSPLHVGDGAWRLEPGEPLEITWKPSPNPGQSAVRVTLNVDEHGAKPVTLTCHSEDVGSLLISSTMIDQLLGFGISGTATGDLYREASDRIDFDEGCIDLAFVAHRKRRVEVASR
jgi:hypothetical protein